MKNKGFTLIELLGVIVILGILMLIAIPNISRVIENSRKSTFVVDTQQIVTESEKEHLSNTNNNAYCKLPNDSTILLDLKNDKELYYYVLLNDTGKVSKIFVYNKKYTIVLSNENGINIETIRTTSITKNRDISSYNCETINNLIDDVSSGIEMQENVDPTNTIYWALQDTNNDGVNDILVLSDHEVTGTDSGSIDRDKKFNSCFDGIPWSKYNYTHNPDYGKNYTSSKVQSIVIDGTIAPTSIAHWFCTVGRNADTFSADLSNLNVSNVTDMTKAFFQTGMYATTFNLNVSNWNTSKVTNMKQIFSSAGRNSTSLNLKKWDVSHVTNMEESFFGYSCDSSSVNLDLSTWDVSSVTNMKNLFGLVGYKASNSFNLNINNWDTSNVTNMSLMFYATGYYAKNVNIDISGFNTSKVEEIRNMFNITCKSSTSCKIIIPRTNSNGINNTTTRLYGIDASTYSSSSESISSRYFTLVE